MRFLIIAIMAALVLDAAAQQAAHDKAYWRGIAAARFDVPAGASAPQLAGELLSSLGSPDPELRDDLALSILTSWIYTKKLLSPDDLRPMVARLQGNLRVGIGESGTDGVLLRSFSALTLSVIAARENDAPFLAPREFDDLLEAALAYFHDERDTRGLDGAKGWMHSAAHTSDLLKFLARNPRLPGAAQSRMLSAVLAKNREAAAPFSQGEDERMARVAISIIRRADFDRDAFQAWLAAAQTMAKFPSPVTAGGLVAQQNVRHLLAALWTELSVDERPSAGADAAKPMLRDVLKTLF